MPCNLALQPILPYYVVYFLVSHQTLFMIFTCIKNSFYLCVGGNHCKLEGQNIGHFDRKTWDINLSTLNHAETRNRAVICNEKYRADVVLAAIFCFVYLKVNNTKDRLLTNIYEFSTPKLGKNKRKIYFALKCRAKFNVLYFSPG